MLRVLASYGLAILSATVWLNVAPTGAFANARDAALPLTIVVNLARQRADAYRGTQHVFSSSISSGKAGHRTPKGIFGIIQKRPRHFSNLYNGAPMPYMQRLTWSGIALHAGAIPGYPASHGCVRLPHSRARQLFSLTRMNTRVVVSNASPRPTVVSHPLLWNRLPPGNPDAFKPDRDPSQQPDQAPQAVSIRTGSVTREGADGRQQLTWRTLRPESGRSIDGSAPLELASVPAIQVATPDGPPRTRAEVARRQAIALSAKTQALAVAKAALAQAKADRDAKGIAVRDASVRARGLAKKLAMAERLRARWIDVKAKSESDLRQFLVENANVSEADPRFKGLAATERALAEAVVTATDEVTIAMDVHAEFALKLASARGRLAEAAEAFKQAKIALAKAGQMARVAQADVASLERAIKMRARPIHILISRKTSKIHIRQGYEDILVAPIEIIDPDKPMGTHLLQPVREADDGYTLQWAAVTVPDAKFGQRVVESRRERARASRRRGRRQRVRYVSVRYRTRDALNRVVIPQHVHQKIAELIKPGSSLIVSDRGPSIETGKGTDYVILTR